MLHESSALGSGGVGDRAGVWVASAAGHAGNDGSALGEGQRVQARSGLPQRLHTHQKLTSARNTCAFLHSQRRRWPGGSEEVLPPSMEPAMSLNLTNLFKLA